MFYCIWFHAMYLPSNRQTENTEEILLWRVRSQRDVLGKSQTWGKIGRKGERKGWAEGRRQKGKGEKNEELKNAGWTIIEIKVSKDRQAWRRNETGGEWHREGEVWRDPYLQEICEEEGRKRGEDRERRRLKTERRGMWEVKGGGERRAM